MIKFFLPFALLFITECATVKFSEADISKEGRVPFTAFNPKPGMDLYLPLRVDIVRQYRTVTKVNANGTTTTKQEPVEYHPVGIELGNGLFLDANRNLTLGLLDVLGLKDKDKFKVIKKGTGFLSSDTIFTRDGTKLVVDYQSILQGKDEYTVTKEGATLKGGILSSDQSIFIEKDKVTYDPKGIFGGISKFSIEKRGQDFVSPGLIWDTVFKFNGKEDEVSLGDELILKNLKTSMEVKRKYSQFSLFSSSIKTTGYTFYRTKDTFLMFNQDGYGMKVIIENKKAIVKVTDFFGSSESEILVD